MTDVLKAIEARSSTRGYMPDKLSKAQLDTLLHAGLQAPTAANRQEIHITVVDGGNPVLAEIEAEKNKALEKAPAANFYYNAPVVLILSGDESFPWTPVDAGIAVENIALAAEGLGLGSLIIGCIRGALMGERKAEFAQKLKLPEGYAYQIAIAVGNRGTSKDPHTYDLARNVTVL